jgi:DNA polymerase III subunit delta'
VSLSAVLGHERIKGVLARALSQGRFPNALLFGGPAGVGKRTLALAAARALLCERSRDGDACGECRACTRSGRGLHPDLALVEPATAVIKIDQVRDAVREIQLPPFEARHRVFVIDEADVMTEQAQNALLKSLEEPKASSHVFLVTASPQALLPTIRSRCPLLRFGPLPRAVVETYLVEKQGLSPAEARLRAALASGSLGAALAFESDTYRMLREELLALLERVASLTPLDRMAEAERLEQAEDPALALTTLRSLLRDLAAARAGSTPDRLLNADVGDRIAALARAPVGARAREVAEEAGETREALRGYANKLLSFETLVETLAG